jgi:hypothetical protein
MTIITKAEDQSKDLGQRLEKFCVSFGVYKLLKRFGAAKMKGISFGKIFDLVFSLVFSGRNLYNTDAPMSRDTVYRFLNNSKIHWERVLLLLATTIITRIRTLTSEKRLCAIVVDDSPYSRNRSKKVELLSKVYDHVIHKYFMGFRMLTLGFTDGNSFIPFASQLMASSKTAKAVSPADRRTLAARRRKNALKTMPERLCELLKTAKAMKIPAKHVLFDSWFSSPLSLITIRNIGFFCVSMLKKNKTGYLWQNESKTLCQIHKALRKRPGRSKYLASTQVVLSHKEFDTPIPAVIVFVRDKSNKKKWCALISTDTSLSEEQIIALYGKRWDIEVFFKMCKSYLKLAKEFEGRSYDMLTAHTAIVFIRYICLAWEQRQNQDDRCFGELFFLVSDELADISFAKALETLLTAFLESLRDAFFLTADQVSPLIDSFLAKLPSFYSNLLPRFCES